MHSFSPHFRCEYLVFGYISSIYPLTTKLNQNIIAKILEPT